MGDDLDASWARVGPRVALLTASAQAGAARSGDDYVAAVLEEQGRAPKVEARTNPRGLVGVASDGRSLDGLLYSAVIEARSAKVESLSERLRVGGLWLGQIVQTQVSDAARDAAKVAMAVRPGVKYVRMVNPPCCQRCAVLAGRFYKVEGFLRHPRCDCFMIPSTVAQPNGFGQSVEPGDIKDLTKAQRRAIDEGADMNRVINSHRAGKRSKDGLTTTEAAGRKRGRLTPEGIYRRAGDDRDKALRLLKEHGYLR